MTKDMDELDRIAEQVKFSSGRSGARGQKIGKYARRIISLREKIRRAQNNDATRKARKK